MHNTISKTFTLNTIIAIFLCLIAITSFWLYEDYSRTISEMQEIENVIIEEHKRSIKKDIVQLARLIEKNREEFYKHAKEHIKSRTNEAYSVAKSLYDYYRDKKSIEEIKEIVRESIRHKRFNNNRGYYFIGDTKGFVQLLADSPEIEGKSIIDMRDMDGRYVVRDMINIIKTKGEGFYEYKWTRPNSLGVNHLKISYLKYFQPFDWFFGTGEYRDDLDRDFIEQTTGILNDFNVGNGSYVFAFDYNGIFLIHPKKDFIGQNLIDIRDKNGKPIVREMLQIANTGDGGYITYLWEKPSTSEILPKISYVKSIEKLGIVIGAGFHPSVFDKLILEKKKLAQIRITRQVVIIILIMVFFSAVAMLVNRYLTKNLKKDFIVFNKFFRQAVDNNQPIDKNQLHFQELITMADSANDMVQRRVALELALEETSKEYKRVFENMIDGLALHEMIYDEQGNPVDYRFIAVNPAFERLTGLKRDDIVGKRVLEVLPDLEYYWIETYGRVVKTGETVSFDSYTISLGKYFEITAYKHSENMFACIFVDVTERVMAFKNLQDLTVTLEEKVSEEVERRRRQEMILIQQSKLASMAEMLISIAHHWRQPLNAVGLIVQSLEDDYNSGTLDSKKLNWAINNVMERLNHMSQVISSFADYIDIRHSSESFGLKGLLYNTLMLISGEMLHNNIDFEVHNLKTNSVITLLDDLTKKEIEEIIIKGDMNYLQQVLLALIRNSIDSILTRQKFVKNKTEKGKIRIFLDDHEHYQIIKIQDNGIGINPEIETRIYEPFFTTKEKSFTVGLGLYMSKVIIEEHFKGRLYHERIDDGAMFLIEIPKDRDDAPPTNVFRYIDNSH